MAFSETIYTITDPTDSTYAFTFDWVRAAHVFCTVNGTAVPAAEYAVTGSSGAASLQLAGATLAALAANDSLRIYKVTPRTFDARTVDFSDEGNVSLAALDDAILHTIALTQDVIDDVADAVVLDEAQGGNFNAQGYEIRNLATGTDAASAVTLSQLQGVETGTGNLPSVDTAFNDYGLVVSSGSWTTASPSVGRTALDLGDVATRDVTIGHPGGVIDRTLGDARYAVQGNDLSDLDDAGTARTNLGLGTSAIIDAGTGASEVLQLDGSGDIPAGVGVDAAIDLSGTSVYHKGGGLYDHESLVVCTEEHTAPVDNDGVVTSDDFDDESHTANNVALDALTQTFRNTSPIEVSVSTANDNFSLTSGTWSIEANITVQNRGLVAGLQRLGLGIYDDTGTTSVVRLNNDRTELPSTSGSAYYSTTTYNLRKIYTFAGAARTFAIRVAGATSADIRVVSATISLRKLAD